eukprot:TRINITY_DN19544_c0_g1_i2.p1 TRINITY_DN19544_c0_g1~~TRINITY_DN19544_c0_g1_i2.p1  ORF type:complete len:666 (+),score=219.50 TRINITY_DN19544_c0_g1_i2:136-2133(+)
MEHPEVPEYLKANARKIEHGLHLWEEPRDPPRDFVERNFASWPVEVQEKHFAEAVLMAVRGTPSILVAPVVVHGSVLKGRDYPPVQFLVSDLVDDAMGSYSEPILGLASDRAIVWRFGKEHIMPYHDGLINQALGAALVGICLELHEFVCTVWDEVQTAAAPLAVVHNRLSPYIPLFSLLRDLLDKHESKCGCMVIKMLEEARTQYIGYPIGEITLKALLDQTTRPFFEILKSWIYEGVNVAPVAWEFPLQKGQNESFMSWELIPSGLPHFLQGCVSQVLQCGKLALILKQANRKYTPKTVELKYDLERPIDNAINSVFQHANSEVLHMLKTDYRLMDRIRFLHHFILCGGGDWVASFMDHCWQHPTCSLKRTVRNARWDELQRSMKNACEASAGSRYPKEWLETLRLEPANKSIIRMVRRMARMQENGYVPSTSSADDAMKQDMDVMQAIQITASLEWPISLVVHPTALAKYQLFGRLVLRVKGLLYVLHRFRRRRGAKLTGDQAASFRQLCALRASMIQFLSNLEMYLLFEVIETGFAKLQTKLAEAKTVEDIIAAHDEFADCFIVSAMATSEGLYKRIEMVFLTIRLFADALEGTETSEKHEKEMVKRFTGAFRERLRDLLKEMQTSSSGKGDSEVQSLQRMLSKLDFNKYYLKENYYGCDE